MRTADFYEKHNEMSVSFNSPASATTGRPVSLGTSALFVAAVIMVAAACGMATYAMGSEQVTKLERLGFILWPNSTAVDAVSSFWDDLVLVRPYSAWYLLIPGQKLCVAFAAAPSTRAEIVTASVIVAGIGGLVSVIRWSIPPTKINALIFLFTIMSIPLAIGNIAESPVTGMTIDLSKGVISDSLTDVGHIMRMTHQTTLRVNHVLSYGRYGRHRIFVRAQNEDGATINLCAFGSYSPANTLERAIVTFINTNGSQL